MSAVLEVNFDGLVGPTHHFAGLSHGNLASATHAQRRSNPRAAALQGLAKMKALADLGLAQAFIPPQPRPDVGFLRDLGFCGTDVQIIERAARLEPRVLSMAYSSSFMWTANAATVAPMGDTRDGRSHFIPANLLSQPHRALEAEWSRCALGRIFADEDRFAVHAPLPGGLAFADEGAANHTRFCRAEGGVGVHFFVYGAEVGRPGAPKPGRYPARQTREACEALVRGLHLDPASVVLAQQNPAAIDAGVFHNDVIATGHRSVHFFHELAFLESVRVRRDLERVFRERTGGDLISIEVPESVISLADAVGSYLFNSQLVTLPDGELCLIAPVECRENPRVGDYLDGLVASDDSPLKRVVHLDLRESMSNGGGPACLRLRVVLTEEERARVHPGVWLTADRHRSLVRWVETYYREELTFADLADPQLMQESRAALEALTGLLGMEQAMTAMAG